MDDELFEKIRLELSEWHDSLLLLHGLKHRANEVAAILVRMREIKPFTSFPKTHWFEPEPGEK